MNMKIASELNSLLEGMKDVSTYGPQDENLRTSIISFGAASLDARTIVSKLDNFGITLAERGISQSDKKKAVRASPHFFNSQSEVETIVSSLKTILK
jgi:cysteine desulfurase/selenocysteine lyase